MNLDPDLAVSIKKLKGEELFRQVIDPSSAIHENYQNIHFVKTECGIVTGVVVKEDVTTYRVATNLLSPKTLTTLRKEDIEQQAASKISPMPNVLQNGADEGRDSGSARLRRGRWIQAPGPSKTSAWAQINQPPRSPS